MRTRTAKSLTMGIVSLCAIVGLGIGATNLIVPVGASKAIIETESASSRAEVDIPNESEHESTEGEKPADQGERPSNRSDYSSGEDERTSTQSVGSRPLAEESVGEESLDAGLTDRLSDMRKSWPNVSDEELVSLSDEELASLSNEEIGLLSSDQLALIEAPPMIGCTFDQADQMLRELESDGVIGDAIGASFLRIDGPPESVVVMSSIDLGFAFTPIDWADYPQYQTHCRTAPAGPNTTAEENSDISDLGYNEEEGKVSVWIVSVNFEGSFEGDPDSPEFAEFIRSVPAPELRQIVGLAVVSDEVQAAIAEALSEE